MNEPNIDAAMGSSPFSPVQSALKDGSGKPPQGPPGVSVFNPEDAGVFFDYVLYKNNERIGILIAGANGISVQTEDHYLREHLEAAFDKASADGRSLSVPATFPIPRDIPMEEKTGEDDAERPRPQMCVEPGHKYYGEALCFLVPPEKGYGLYCGRTDIIYQI